MTKRPVLILSLLLTLLPALPLWVQAQSPVPLDDYRLVIDRALEMVERAESQPAADLLAAITAVELPDGETMPVDHGWFVRSLRADNADLDAVATRLKALRHELDAWPVGAPAAGDFDKLAKILSRPEFQPNSLANALPLQQWLDRLLDFLPGPVGVPWLGDLLAIAAIVVLAGVVVYFAAGLWGSFASQAVVDEENPDAEPLTASQALSRSRQMAQTGDYRTAVRLLYLSTLLMLEERNLLRYDRTLTNREYLRQAADKPALVGALRPVVDTFDEVWYGQIEPDAERYRAYAQQVEQVQEVKE